jgi:hypothetical protein
MSPLAIIVPIGSILSALSFCGTIIYVVCVKHQQPHVSSLTLTNQVDGGHSGVAATQTLNIKLSNEKSSISAEQFSVESTKSSIVGSLQESSEPPNDALAKTLVTYRDMVEYVTKAIVFYSSTDNAEAKNLEEVEQVSELGELEEKETIYETV